MSHRNQKDPQIKGKDRSSWTPLLRTVVPPVIGVLSFAQTASAASRVIRRNPFYAVVGAVGVGLLAGFVRASFPMSNREDESLSAPSVGKG